MQADRCNEEVTPHKVSLCILLFTYADHDQPAPPRLREELALFLLAEIKQPTSYQEKTLAELNAALTPLTHGATIIQRLEDEVSSVKTPDDLFDILHVRLKTLLQQETIEDCSAFAGKLSRTSVFGIFVRHVILAAESNMFSGLSRLYQAFVQYVQQPATAPRGNLFCSQLEAFVHAEAERIEGASDSGLPVATAAQVEEMVQLAPHVPKIHYLRFLRCLRDRQLVGAIESLHCYFDNAMGAANSGTGPEIGSRKVAGVLPYGLLNLAVLHHRFGHREQAMRAVEETVCIAHQNNDATCLVHVLGWMHRLSSCVQTGGPTGGGGVHGQLQLLQQCISSATQLQQPSVAALGHISLAALLLHHGAARLFTGKDNLLAQRLWSSLSSGQRSATLVDRGHSQLMGQVHAAQAAAWSALGAQRLAQLHAHLGVQVHALDGAMPSNESCLLRCRRALNSRPTESVRLLLEAYDTTDESAKGYWERVVARTLHERALMRGELMRASALQLEICALSCWDRNTGSSHQAKIAQIQGMLRAGQGAEATIAALQLVESSQQPQKDNSLEALHLAASACLQCGDNCAALVYALRCMNMAQECEAEMAAAAVVVVAAAALLEFGLSAQALQALEMWMPTILGDAPLFVCGSAQLVVAKCHLSRGAEGLQSALLALNEALEAFTELQAFKEMESTIYLLARTHHALGDCQKRNEAAVALRVVEQEAASCRREQSIWGHEYGNCLTALKIEQRRAQEKDELFQRTVCQLVA